MKAHWEKSKVTSLLDVLNIPYSDWSDPLELGSSERTILNAADITHLVKNYCFVGTDGTVASVSDDMPNAPALIGGGAALWGIQGNRTRTFPFYQRILDEAGDRSYYSAKRTVLELMEGVCIAKARKLRAYACDGCPFSGRGCVWPDDPLEPWNFFEGKTTVVVFDLPVEFNFVFRANIGKNPRKLFTDNLKNIFHEIRIHDIPVIFVTHNSTLKPISEIILDEFNAARQSFDVRARSLVEILREASSTVPAPGGEMPAKILSDTASDLKDPLFTDYDLLGDWFGGIGVPSPVFGVPATELNNNWDKLAYHYYTWGQDIHVTHRPIYAPSGWVRIGYSPALDPATAQKLALLDASLGRGHSISLTMAHTLCNQGKTIHVKLLRDKINLNRPDHLKFGQNLKTLRKGRLFNYD